MPQGSTNHFEEMRYASHHSNPINTIGHALPIVHQRPTSPHRLSPSQLNRYRDDHEIDDDVVEVGEGDRRRHGRMEDAEASAENECSERW